MDYMRLKIFFEKLIPTYYVRSKVTITWYKCYPYKMTAKIVCAIITILPTFAYEYPFRNPNLRWQDRVNDLVNRLTLEEIINQTFISNVEGDVQSVVPAIQRLNINPFVWKTDCTRGIAHTNATAFPQDIGLAASFRYDKYYCTAVI